MNIIKTTSCPSCGRKLATTENKSRTYALTDEEGRVQCPKCRRVWELGYEVTEVKPILKDVGTKLPVFPFVEEDKVVLPSGKYFDVPKNIRVEVEAKNLDLVLPFYYRELSNYGAPGQPLVCKFKKIM